jgi:ATP-binding cassette subfamily D (ALD) protein 3
MLSINVFCVDVYHSLTHARVDSTMLGYLLLSGAVLTTLRRPVGKLTVQEQQYEGEFRFVNSRVITNGEEIAFYQGNRKELRFVTHYYYHYYHHHYYYL